MIRFDNVTKRFADGTVAVDQLSIDMPTGEITVLVGLVGLRQDDDAADDQPPDRAHAAARITIDGRDVAAAAVPRAAARHRLRHPAGRPVPPPHGRSTTSTTVPSLLGWDKKRPAPRALELLELVGLDRRRTAERYPAPALGRPAAARRRGPGPRRRPAGAADGRAVRRRRPDRARPSCSRSSSACSASCTRPSCSSPTTSTRRSCSATASPCCSRAATSSSSARRASCSPSRPTRSSPTSSAHDRGLKLLSLRARQRGAGRPGARPSTAGALVTDDDRRPVGWANGHAGGPVPVERRSARATRPAACSTRRSSAPTALRGAGRRRRQGASASCRYESIGKLLAERLQAVAVILAAPSWSGDRLSGNWDVLRYYTLEHLRITLIALGARHARRLPARAARLPLAAHLRRRSCRSPTSSTRSRRSRCSCCSAPPSGRS